MRHHYQDLDRGHFDYALTRLTGIEGQLFRGPAVDRSRPYLVCAGAAQTFGRFCERPFPALLADRLETQVQNLAVGAAGPRQFDQPAFLHWLNAAQLVVVQVLSGRSESNSLFDTSTSGGMYGARMRDGVKMKFRDFFNELFETEPLEVVERVVAETRENYVRHMKRLFEQIRPPKILLWFSARTPDLTDDYSAAWKLIGEFPQLVNRAMIDQIRPHCDAYVECASQRGIPQRLWKTDQPVPALVLENGVLYNRYYPSPEMHELAADLLEPECRRLMDG